MARSSGCATWDPESDKYCTFFSHVQILLLVVVKTMNSLMHAYPHADQSLIPGSPKHCNNIFICTQMSLGHGQLLAVGM